MKFSHPAQYQYPVKAEHVENILCHFQVEKDEGQDDWVLRKVSRSSSMNGAHLQPRTLPQSPLRREYEEIYREVVNEELDKMGQNRGSLQRRTTYNSTPALDTEQRRSTLRRAEPVHHRPRHEEVQQRVVHHSHRPVVADISHATAHLPYALSERKNDLLPRNMGVPERPGKNTEWRGLSRSEDPR